MTPDELRRIECRVHTVMHPDQEIVASPISETMCYVEPGCSPPVVIPLYTRDPARIEPMMKWLDARVDYPVYLYFAMDEWGVGEWPGHKERISRDQPTPNLALCHAVLAVGEKGKG